MTRMNPLPPQAFTKETLQKAYLWLNSQGPHIKELATTPELLVSLYLKAQRNGEESLNRPSIQNFKNELKNLAGMMGEFETHPQAHVQDIADSLPLTQDFMSGASNHNASTLANSFNNTNTNPGLLLPNISPSETSSLPLDPRSIGMIQEVKNQFNLSTDSEALRLLISLGYSKAKTIL